MTHPGVTELAPACRGEIRDIPEIADLAWNRDGGPDTMEPDKGSAALS